MILAAFLSTLVQVVGIVVIGLLVAVASYIILTLIADYFSA